MCVCVCVCVNEGDSAKRVCSTKCFNYVEIVHNNFCFQGVQFVWREAEGVRGSGREVVRASEIWWASPQATTGQGARAASRRGSSANGASAGHINVKQKVSLLFSYRSLSPSLCLCVCVCVCV